MNKNKWCYENARTGGVTDIRETMDWWAIGGDNINCWYWSEFSQEWEIVMVREA